MSKAVLISIQPKWCEKIANGEKTVEVRKTYPKLGTPFKCYIYCTKPKFPHEDHITLFDKQRCFYAGGLVIGEFVCDGIYAVLRHPDIFAGHPLFYKSAIEAACLTENEIEEYSGGKDLCGWHISGLEIYDKPKLLGEFIKPCENDLYCEVCAMYSEFTEQCGNKALRITRPPQSWCYVEEVKGDGDHAAT